MLRSSLLFSNAVSPMIGIYLSFNLQILASRLLIRLFYPICIRSISPIVVFSNAEPHNVFVSSDHLFAKVLMQSPAGSVLFRISI